MNPGRSTNKLRLYASSLTHIRLFWPGTGRAGSGLATWILPRTQEVYR